MLLKSSANDCRDFTDNTIHRMFVGQLKDKSYRKLIALIRDLLISKEALTLKIQA